MINLKKPIIIANWKMNPVSFKEAKTLFEEVRNGIKRLKGRSAEVIFCIPYTWLDGLNSAFSKSTKANIELKLGAQDVFWESKGAFTGEISPLMLKNLGCQYVIVGHSERRKYLGETDETVNLKIKTALRCSLNVILAVGEDTRQNSSSSSGSFSEIGNVVGQQLKKGLAGISSAKMQDIMIAYEPVWAIGTGDACSPDQAMKAELYIKKVLTDLFQRKVAENTAILYGGSVNSKNAADYVKEASMNGLLVGGASLSALEFVKIIETVCL